IDQPADIFRGQIRPQSPRGIDVTECADQIRYIGIHHAFVRPGLREIEERAVDYELHFTEHDEVETRSRHDDVGRKLLARLQTDSRLGEVVNVFGDYGRHAGADRREKVVVRHQA